MPFWRFYCYNHHQCTIANFILIQNKYLGERITFKTTSLYTLVYAGQIGNYFYKATAEKKQRSHSYSSKTMHALEPLVKFSMDIFKKLLWGSFCRNAYTVQYCITVAMYSKHLIFFGGGGGYCCRIYPMLYLPFLL